MSFETGGAGTQIGGASFGLGIDLQSFERDLDRAEAVARARVARIQGYFDNIRASGQAGSGFGRAGGGPNTGPRPGETTADLNRTIRRNEHVIVNRTYRLNEAAKPPAPVNPADIHFTQQVTIARVYHALNPSLPQLSLPAPIRQTQRVHVDRSVTVGELPVLPQVGQFGAIDRRQEIRIQRVAHTQEIRIAAQPVETPPVVRRVQIIEIANVYRAVPGRIPQLADLPSIEQSQRVRILRSAEAAPVRVLPPPPREISPALQQQRVLVSRQQVLAIQGAQQLPSLSAPDINLIQRVLLSRVTSVVTQLAIPPASQPPILALTQDVLITRRRRLVPVQQALQAPGALPALTGNQEYIVRRLARVVGPAALPVPQSPQPITQSQAITIQRTAIATYRPAPALSLPQPVTQRQLVYVTRETRYVAVQQSQLPPVPAPPRVPRIQVIEINRQQQVREATQLPPPSPPVPVQQRQLVSVERQTLVTGRPIGQPALPAPVSQIRTIAVRDVVVQVGAKPVAPAPDPQQPIFDKQLLLIARTARVTGRLALPAPPAPQPINQNQDLTVRRIERLVPPAALPPVATPPPGHLNQVIAVDRILQPINHALPALPAPAAVRLDQQVTIQRQRRAVDSSIPPLLRLPGVTLQQIITVSRLLRLGAAPQYPALPVPPRPVTLTRAITLLQPVRVETPRAVAPPALPGRIHRTEFVDISQITRTTTSRPQAIATQLPQIRALPAATRTLDEQRQATVSAARAFENLAQSINATSDAEAKLTESARKSQSQTQQQRDSAVQRIPIGRNAFAELRVHEQDTVDDLSSPEHRHFAQALQQARQTTRGATLSLDPQQRSYLQRNLPGHIERLQDNLEDLQGVSGASAVAERRSTRTRLTQLRSLQNRLPVQPPLTPARQARDVVIASVPRVLPLPALPSPTPLRPIVQSEDVIVNRVNRLGTTAQLALAGASAVPVLTQTQELAVRRVVRLVGATPRIPVALPPPTIPQVQTLAITRVARVVSSLTAPVAQSSLPVLRQTQPVVISRTYSTQSERPNQQLVQQSSQVRTSAPETPRRLVYTQVPNRVTQPERIPIPVRQLALPSRASQALTQSVTTVSNRVPVPPASGTIEELRATAERPRAYQRQRTEQPQPITEPIVTPDANQIDLPPKSPTPVRRSRLDNINAIRARLEALGQRLQSRASTTVEQGPVSSPSVPLTSEQRGEVAVPQYSPEELYTRIQTRRIRLAQRERDDATAQGSNPEAANARAYSFLTRVNRDFSDTPELQAVANRQLALPAAGQSSTPTPAPIVPIQQNANRARSNTSRPSRAQRNADDLHAQLVSNGVHPDDAAKQVRQFTGLEPGQDIPVVSATPLTATGGGSIPPIVPPVRPTTFAEPPEPNRPIPLRPFVFQSRPAGERASSNETTRQTTSTNPLQNAANTFFQQRVSQGISSAQAAREARQNIGIAPDLPEAQQATPASPVTRSRSSVVVDRIQTQRSRALIAANRVENRSSQQTAESTARDEGAAFSRVRDRQQIGYLPGDEIPPSAEDQQAERAAARARQLAQSRQQQARARVRVQSQRQAAREAQAQERAAARPQQPVRSQSELDRLIGDAGLGEDTPARRGRAAGQGGDGGTPAGPGGTGGRASGGSGGGGILGTGISQTQLRVGAALFGGVGLGLNVIAGIARDIHNAVASAVNDAAQINRSLNEIGVAYGQLGSKQIQSGAGIFASDQSTKGTTQQYLETAAALQNLTSQYGLSTQQIQGLITASGQLARIHGTDLPTASQELQRVLGGDAEAAQNLGVNLTDEYGRLRSVGVSFSDLAGLVGRARAEQILFADVQSNVAAQQTKAASSVDATTAALDKISKQADTARNALAQLVSKPFEVVVNVIANVVSGFNGGNQVQNAAIQQATNRRSIGAPAPAAVLTPTSEQTSVHPVSGLLDAAANAGLIDKRFASQPSTPAQPQAKPQAATSTLAGAPVTTPLAAPKTPGDALQQRASQIVNPPSGLQLVSPTTGQPATQQQQADFAKSFAPALQNAPPLLDQVADAQKNLGTATDGTTKSLQNQLTAIEQLRLANQQLISQPGNIRSIEQIQKQIGEHQTIATALQGPNFPLAPLAPEQVSALAAQQVAADSLQRQAVPFVASRQQNEVRARLESDVARATPDRNQGAVDALNDLNRREGSARDLINAQHNQAVAQNAVQQAQTPVDRLQIESEARRLGAQQQLNDLTSVQIQLQNDAAPALLQEADIRDRITLASQQNLDLTRQRLLAEQAAKPASNALEDLNFVEQQATQRAVVAGVQRSQGQTPSFDIKEQSKIIRDAVLAKPQAELANTEAQRGVTVATRADQASQLQKQIDVIPLQQQEQNLQPGILGNQAAQRAAQAQADALQRSLQSADLGSGPQRIEAETALLNARLQEVNATGAVASAQAGVAGIPPVQINLTVPGNIELDPDFLSRITDAAGAGAIAAITAARASGTRRVPSSVAGGR